MSNDLRGQFIANTFQNLMQKPDLSKEEYFNGLGQPITVINRDAIGTIKMFYPVGATLSAYFDDSTGIGIPGTEWEGWHICNGNSGTPDLRNCFVMGYDGLTGNVGDGGGNNSKFIDITELPDHTHILTGGGGGIGGSGYANFNVGDDGITTTIGKRTRSGIYQPGTTTAVGSQQLFDNRPSYVSLYYVIRIS